jgi:hypothetical protein
MKAPHSPSPEREEEICFSWDLNNPCPNPAGITLLRPRVQVGEGVLGPWGVVGAKSVLDLVGPKKAGMLPVSTRVLVDCGIMAEGRSGLNGTWLEFC